MAVELATAYVSLVPETSKIAPGLKSALGSSEVTGAASKSGKVIGSSLFGAVAGVAASATSKAFGAISSSVGAAISRVDIINNFPKIMQNLGYSSDDASASIAKMSDKLTGLPTALDSMAGVVQQLAPLTGGLDKATGLSLALNNALLAGGKSTDIQANAMEQYTQMLAVGKPDMAAWRSMVSAMPGQMDQLAKSMLGADAKQTDLYDALKTGKVSFDDFNKAILNLNDKGLKGYASFADQAKDATGGVATAQANLGTAITRGLANVIAKLKPQISGLLGGLTDVVNAAGPIVIGMIDGIGAAFAWVKANSDWIGPVAVGLGTIVGAIVAWNVATRIWVGIQAIVAGVQAAYIAATYGMTAASYGYQGASKIATAAQWLFNAALNANPIMLVITAIAALVAGLIWFFTQTKLGKEVWANVTAFIKSAWQSTVDIFLNSIGMFVDFFNNTLGMFVDFGGHVAAVWNGLWSGIGSFFKGVWDSIVGWVQEKFTLVFLSFQVIGQAISAWWNGLWAGIGSFFSGIWDGIVGAVRKFGGFFQDAFAGIKGFVQSAFKGVLGVVKAPINGLIGLVNSAINGLNSLSVSIPGWVPIVGGQTWGLSLPTIPQLAAGGIVKAGRGGSLVNVGEGRYDEAVVPLGGSQLNSLAQALAGAGSGREINMTVNPAPGMDERTIGVVAARELAWQLRGA